PALRDGSYALSLHDALPILSPARGANRLGNIAGSALRDLRQFLSGRGVAGCKGLTRAGEASGDEMTKTSTLAQPVADGGCILGRSEEHTSELQSRENIVCRL